MSHPTIRHSYRISQDLIKSKNDSFRDGLLITIIMSGPSSGASYPASTQSVSSPLETRECRTKIINIISGPGSGKTTLSTLIFAHLKLRRKLAEYAPEIAKTLVWQERYSVLNNQYQVSTEQYQIFKKMVGKVEYVITDGSLLHGLYYNRYNRDNVCDIIKTEQKILEYFREFDNLVIWLERGDFPYEKAGRQQTETEAKLVDVVLKRILDDYQIPYKTIHLEMNDKGEPLIDEILDFITQS